MDAIGFAAADYPSQRKLIGYYPQSSGGENLQPYEAVVYQL